MCGGYYISQQIKIKKQKIKIKRMVWMVRRTICAALCRTKKHLWYLIYMKLD